MKKIFCSLFLLIGLVAHAQDEPQKISLSFENSELSDVISEIEEKTNYKFYYVEGWINEVKVTGTYENKPVPVILNDIFGETLINFFIMDPDKVILAKNSVIYTELPPAFFKDTSEIREESKEEIAENINPVFHTPKINTDAGEIETISIGKQNTSISSGKFLISGVVKNAETGDPIPNLAIVIKDSEKGTVTDEKGYFEIRLSGGTQILQTKSMGFEDVQKRLIIYNDGHVNLNLRTDYEQLGEVFLESNADENVERAVTGIEQIDVERIKYIPLILGERDILKVATTLPGISSAGEGASGYHVRGGRADQNLILLDDAVVYNPFHFFGIFSALNPFTTGKVNIYKGSMPAKYGGRLSSVFDLRTKDANTTELSGEASIGPVTGNLLLEIPVIEEKSGVLIGARGTYSDWLLNMLDEESLKNKRATFYDVITKYNHKFTNNTKVQATGYFSRDIFSITADSLLSYNNLLFSTKLDHRFNNKHKGSLILANSNYKFNVDYQSPFNNDFNSGYQINQSKFQVDMEYKFNNAHTFNYGFSSKLYIIHPGSIEPTGAESLIEPLEIPREKGLESAVYFADNFEVNEKLLLNLGLRYSHYMALGSSIGRIYDPNAPKTSASVTDTVSFGNNEVIKSYGGMAFRASARYLLTSDLSVKAGYNNAYQYLHALSSNTTASPTDTYKLSGLHVKPQKAQQFSLGLYQNLNDNMYELSLETYYKTSENLLDYKVGAQLFLNENLETEVIQGVGKSYGVELLLKKTYGKLNGWLGYSYSRSLVKLDGEFPQEIINNGEYFPSNFDKPHDLSVVANYKLTQRFSFSANFVYQTGRPVTYPIATYHFQNSEYVLYSDRNQYRIPDYYRLDLSFNVEGNHKKEKIGHSFWNISVYNVLGRNNPYSVFFVTDDGEVKAYQSSIFSIPVPTITYNIKF